MRILIREFPLKESKDVNRESTSKLFRVAGETPQTREMKSHIWRRSAGEKVLRRGVRDCQHHRSVGGVDGTQWVAHGNEAGKG